MADCHGSGPSVARVAEGNEAARTVALVGPPNSGKTTLFNRLTGLRQKVANFPGVTVEQHTGVAQLEGGGEVEIIDLPGVYSLSPRSEDEQVTHDVLKGLRPGVAVPDAIVLVLDSTNLRRHLMLAAPILALGKPTLVVLNMADDLRARGGRVDLGELATQLGAPVTLASARAGEGIEAVFSFLAAPRAGGRVPVQLPILQDVPKCREWAGRVGTHARYHAPAPPIWTRRLDSLFLHPVAGPLVFLAVVLAVFQTIFTAATPLMDGVRWLFAISGSWLTHTLPDTPFRSLLVEAIWTGVGSVMVFLPQVLLLFLFIGILEDSGYLARAALIADRTMAKVGLQGKSFIPLLSAYACAVPAILATRTIENKRDRFATILIAPFMTCSARLPVYTLIIAAFIPERPVLGSLIGSRAASLLGLYLIGFLAAVATAKVLKSSVLKSGRTPFLLEMPSYRWPTFQSIGLRLLDRAGVFVRRAGTIILLVTIVLWVMAHLPLQDGKAPPIEQSVAGTLGRTIEPLIKPLGFNWKIGIGLISSLAAREVIVSTLASIYGMEGDSQSVDLQKALQKDLSLSGAVALLIFFAFAMQCVSTIAVVRRETGGWMWPIAQFCYMGTMAYLGAFLAFRLVR
jgi:ferrous iron transport protein B